MWSIPVVGAIGLVVGWYASRPTSELDCKTALTTASEALAVVICQREYEQTDQPSTGARFAEALWRSDRIEAASAIAGRLIHTPARADALRTLSEVAGAQGRAEEAIRLQQEARALHRALGQRAQLAQDDQALANLQVDQQQYADALHTLDECVETARAIGDEVNEAYCHMSSARALMYAGYFDAAAGELEAAKLQLHTDRDRSELKYWQGNLEQELVRDPLHPDAGRLAVEYFEQSLELATHAGVKARIVNLHLNLAYSLAELQRVDDAELELKASAALDLQGEYKSQRIQLAARIAYRRGDHARASALNEQVYPTITDPDEQIDVCVMQARIALATSELAHAELWSRRGIAVAEQVRNAQASSELRPWVLASRREAFELLFLAFARGHRVEAAFGVFDQWQARTLLDAMVRPSSDPAFDRATAPSKIGDVQRWLSASSKTPTMSADRPTLPAVVSELDLLALAVADGEVWRLVSSHGQLALDRLDSLANLRDRLDQFMAAPTASAPASALGALILPARLVRVTREPLYVVLDAQLAGLPVVALRSRLGALIEARPVLHTPRLPVAGACRLRTADGGALVMGDAATDLPDARREAIEIAALVGVTPLLGDAATRTALFAARSTQLLHIAVHADFDVGGGVLRLHDRSVSAPEIAASQFGASLVVLAACNTAWSGDPELARSLSTAFLISGADRVIATLRSVPDANTLDVTTRFYREHGAVDPVRVLARVQADLVHTTNADWPNFAIFGEKVCEPSP